MISPPRLAWPPALGAVLAPCWHSSRALPAGRCAGTGGRRACAVPAADCRKLRLCFAYKSKPVSYWLRRHSLFQQTEVGEGRELPEPSWSLRRELTED